MLNISTRKQLRSLIRPMFPESEAIPLAPTQSQNLPLPILSSELLLLVPNLSLRRLQHLTVCFPTSPD